jgi:hypothetical protein
MSTIACFGVLAGGTAYAAATIGSEEVIDESLLSQDIKNGNVKTADIALDAITSNRINNGSVLNSEIGTSAVTGAKVASNSLTSDDIQESTLTTVPSSSSGRVVMRALGGSLTASNTPAPYPLTNASWSQVPGESAVIFGEASFTTPPNCAPPSTGFTPGTPSVSLVLKLDGTRIQAIGHDGPTFSQFVFERPTGGTRTFTAELHDNCTEDHFVVDSLAVNAYGMR